MLRKYDKFQMKPHLPPKTSPKPVDIVQIKFSISQFPDGKMQNKSLKAFYTVEITVSNYCHNYIFTGKALIRTHCSRIQSIFILSI